MYKYKLCSKTWQKCQEDRDLIWFEQPDKDPVDFCFYIQKKNNVIWLILYRFSVCLHVCVCTCVCSSASLNRMNQWLENRPAFCRVRDLLLLSQTTRRCGRRRTSWWTNTHVLYISSIKEGKVLKTTLYHKSCLHQQGTVIQLRDIISNKIQYLI